MVVALMPSRPNIAGLLSPDAIMAMLRSWSWLQWFGLALVLTAYYLPRFASISASADDALDHLALIGGTFMGWTGTQPPPTPATPSPPTEEPKP